MARLLPERGATARRRVALLRRHRRPGRARAPRPSTCATRTGRAAARPRCAPSASGASSSRRRGTPAAGRRARHRRRSSSSPRWDSAAAITRRPGCAWRRCSGSTSAAAACSTSAPGRACSRWRRRASGRRRSLAIDVDRRRPRQRPRQRGAERQPAGRRVPRRPTSGRSRGLEADIVVANLTGGMLAASASGPRAHGGSGRRADPQRHHVRGTRRRSGGVRRAAVRVEWSAEEDGWCCALLAGVTVAVASSQQRESPLAAPLAAIARVPSPDPGISPTRTAAR